MSLKPKKEEDVVRDFQKMLEEMYDELAPFAAKKIGVELYDFNKKSKISIDDTLIINGRTFSNDNWMSFEINIFSGFLIYIHKMNKVFISTMETASKSEPNKFEIPIISLEDMISIATNLISAYWKLSIFSVPSVPFKDLTELQIEIAGRLNRYAELFLVGHELGHVILNKNPSIAKDYQIDFDEKIDSGTKEKWTEEHLADLLGLELCLQLGDEWAEYGLTDQNRLTYLAIEVLFLSQDLLLRYISKDGHINYNDTHPPSYSRLVVIRDYIKKNVNPEWLSIGEQFEIISELILPI
jgi:hypothetical protein